MTRYVRLSLAFAVVAAVLVPAAATAAAPPFGGIQTLSPSGHLTYQPVVALDAAGNATAFWSYSSTSRHGMKIAGRATGEGFAPASSLPTPGSNQLAYPAIDVSPNGTTAVAWVDEVDDQVALLAAYRPAGGDWGSYQVVAESTGSNEAFTYPSIAVSDSGRVVVTYWHYLDDGSHNIEAALSDTAGVFAAPAVLDNRMSTESVANHGPKAGIDAAGNAMVVWERYDDDTEVTTVQYASAGAAGGFGSATLIATVDQDGIDPRIAVNPDGDAVAIWIHTLEGADAVLGSARGTTTTGLVSLGLLAQPMPAGRPDWIDVAIDATGNAVAAWRGLTTENDVIQASILAPTAVSWTAAQTLDDNSDTDNSLETSDETLDVAAASGSAIVAWARQDAHGYMPVHVSTLDAATGLFDAKTTVSSATADVDAVRVDMNKAGDTALVWRNDYRIQTLGTWDPPARGTLTTRATVGRRIVVSGSLTPADPGKGVSVTLYRKRAGTFKKIAAKTATLNQSSAYRAGFSRPKPGTCRVKALFPGDGLVQRATATKTFGC